MKDTDTRTAEEFARRWQYGSEARKAMGEELASRDAHRERQALEAAIDRVAHRTSYTGDAWRGLRAAILGEPTFVKGQLVENINGHFEVWKGYDIPTTGFYPVSAHLDAEGRVIVDDEGGTP